MHTINNYAVRGYHEGPSPDKYREREKSKAELLKDHSPFCKVKTLKTKIYDVT